MGNPKKNIMIINISICNIICMENTCKWVEEKREIKIYYVRTLCGKRRIKRKNSSIIWNWGDITDNASEVKSEELN